LESRSYRGAIYSNSSRVRRRYSTLDNLRRHCGCGGNSRVGGLFSPSMWRDRRRIPLKLLILGKSWDRVNPPKPVDITPNSILVHSSKSVSGALRLAHSQGRARAVIFVAGGRVRGNASAVEMAVDGVSVGLLGGRGKLRKGEISPGLRLLPVLSSDGDRDCWNNWPPSKGPSGTVLPGPQTSEIKLRVGLAD